MAQLRLDDAKGRHGANNVLLDKVSGRSDFGTCAIGLPRLVLIKTVAFTYEQKHDVSCQNHEKDVYINIQLLV